MGDQLPEDQITLRALRDVNVPKFLKARGSKSEPMHYPQALSSMCVACGEDDLPLFELLAQPPCLSEISEILTLSMGHDGVARNIISDLFPTTERPVVEYGNLTPVMEACGKVR